MTEAVALEPTASGELAIAAFLAEPTRDERHRGRARSECRVDLRTLGEQADPATSATEARAVALGPVLERVRAGRTVPAGHFGGDASGLSRRWFITDVSAPPPAAESTAASG